MSETTIFPDFNRDAWPLYERKGKKKLALAEWNKLSHKDRESAYDGILPSGFRALHQVQDMGGPNHRTWKTSSPAVKRRP